ncbi:MAG: amino acid adenylation domain-containing protein [Phormidium sp.]
MVAHHSVFRTAFVWESLAQPVQVVLRQVDVKLQTTDWRELSAPQQQQELQVLLDADRQLGFSFSRPPLMRLHLIQWKENTYQFVWSFHHILLDGWSLPLVFQDLWTCYQAISQGKTLNAQLSKSYRNYIAWLGQQDVAKSQAYWRGKLQGFSVPTPLTFDKPLSNREKGNNVSYGEQEIKLSVAATAAAISFVREQQLTLNNLVQATWAILLSRYSQETDLVFGVTVSGRPPIVSGVESIVGLFINTLPVRVQISENTELLGLLKDLQVQLVESEQYSYSSLVEIQGYSDVPRGTSLFDSIVVFENYPIDNTTSEDNEEFSLSNFRGIEQTNYPLTFVAAPGEQLLLRISYDGNRFDDGSISRMLGHFVTLLEAIVASPMQLISQLPMLTEFEQHQLLIEWNQTKIEYPVDKCVHQLFEAQVERTPNAVAVVFEEEQLTYNELNSRSNQLAHYLRSLGVGADVLVGICAERSLEMIVGLLGILKAGGAYVPLDPEYPAERLNFMLEDSQVGMLLTQQRLVDKLSIVAAQKVCLDTDWLEISQWSQDNLSTNVQAENLAYIIYTSGSTGQPKGVLVSHQSLLNLVFWHQRTFEITSTDKATQLAGTAFDAAVWELWPYLSAGASVYLVTSEVLYSPTDLRDWLIGQKISISFLPTPLAERLLLLEWNEEVALRTMLIGGDKLHNYPSQLVPFQVVNNYGPTENTVVTTSGLVVSNQESNVSSPAIGRPIANTQVYILDGNLQPVPLGVPGELHIGGASLAKGYLNRLELTNEKFIPNPFSDEPNSRLYKTGDKVRYLPNGNIEYLGRIDNQVKIRGFRIELGEIESILSQHPQVQASVVVAREDIPEDKRLVAYIVTETEATADISELRQYLKTRIPEYMIPSVFVILETLPLTLNGKVDRRALPKPDFHNAQKDRYEPPRTPIEEILVNLWGQILNLNLVGIHDNFFALGGHSLIATQLMSRLRSHLQVELPLQSLFEAPTVAELAYLIGQLKQQNSQLALPSIFKRKNNSDLPLSYAQTRLWFIDQFEPNSGLYNISAALRLVGMLNVTALEGSFQEIVQRHEALRTNFINLEGQAAQIIYTETNWKLLVVDLKELPTNQQEITVTELVQQQAIQPFDLANDALLRASLIKLSETEHILILCMHHIVNDGWSIGVFVKELAELYNAYAQGQPSPLSPLPIQYADFALWQREWLQGEVLQTQLSYWKEQLADVPSLLSLPTDRPRKAVQTFVGAHREFELSAELTEKLTQLSQERGVTLFMTLLAGFKTLLYRYTGESNILIGTPIANRNQSEIEGLIGFFVNTLVLRTNLSEDPSFIELLDRVRQVSLAAYTHQDLPFEMLVEALQPKRSLSYSPLFQVMFVLQNAPVSQLELEGLAISPIEVENAIAKFDLTLSMENTPNGLVGLWEYNTDLFDGNTIERMTGHFLTLLSAIIANPQERISQLSLLMEAEQQQLIEWNHTQIDYPLDKSLHQLFEEQCLRTPDAVAVVFESKQLTYQELNNRANQLAHYLRSLGVGADVLVGICVERSLEMLVGLLGILKAGGAYVPLDPNYPTERLAFMLSDSQVSILLTQENLVKKLPQLELHLISLDADWEIIAQQSQSNIFSQVGVENLAYVIYTSGSTGKPKGVQITHFGVTNFLHSMKQELGITESDILLAVTTICFDIAALELYLPLLVGAQVVLVPREQTVDGVKLSAKLLESGATIMQATPATWRLLLAAGWQGNPGLKILCGGEALAGSLSMALLVRSECLWNVYGPTETTIWSTIYEVKSSEGATDFLDFSESIGRPIANTEIHILDSFLQIVPIGVVGELYIGGAGLARGYLNQPELTNEKFIPNPFSKEPNSRLYKTGDLARYQSDGNIEYLGRIDNQVKIHGFRIELGEIEAVLNQYPQVQTSVVIADEDVLGDRRLVAYTVTETETTITTNELRQYLKAKLPDYMVPSAFVMLEFLPLTPNGKIDRRALPTPDFYPNSDTYVSPRNPVELKLAQIWSKILKLDNVGVKDNFFGLGGHSLLTPYLIAQIKQHFNQDISLATFFQNPTIEQLAIVVQKDTATSDYSPLIALQPMGSRPPLFCLPGAGGYPFYLYNLARCFPPDQPFYTFQANHSDERKLMPANRIKEIAAGYVQAMQALQPQGPYFLAGHSFGGRVAYEMAQQLVCQGQEVALVAILDTNAPISGGKEVNRSDIQWLIDFAQAIKIAFAKDLELDTQQLLTLAADAQVQYVLEYLKILDLLPPDADATYLWQLAEAYQADNKAEYFPQQVHRIPISLFRSSEFKPEEFEIAHEVLQDSAWGWNNYSSKPVDVEFVPGDHITMMTPPNVQVLAERLNACLNQAQSVDQKVEDG